jgi:hypothetical protein
MLTAKPTAQCHTQQALAWTTFPLGKPQPQPRSVRNKALLVLSKNAAVLTSRLVGSRRNQVLRVQPEPDRNTHDIAATWHFAGALTPLPAWAATPLPMHLLCQPVTSRQLSAPNRTKATCVVSTCRAAHQLEPLLDQLLSGIINMLRSVCGAAWQAHRWVSKSLLSTACSIATLHAQWTVHAYPHDHDCLFCR